MKFNSIVQVHTRATRCRQGTKSDMEHYIKAQKYRRGARKCDLCLTEKLVILKCNDPKQLNQRSNDREMSAFKYALTKKN